MNGLNMTEFVVVALCFVMMGAMILIAAYSSGRRTTA